jgi:hypothetical protein
MQKIATTIFVYASLTFGVLGIITILAAPKNDNDATDLNVWLMKLLVINVFIILPSFALSIAAKYLNHRS